MKIEVEVSRPHYHPSHESAEELNLTKKRDLSVPPHWVANERVTNPETGESFAVVMPPRDEELYEVRQPVHIHMPEYVEVKVGKHTVLAKIKVQAGTTFEPRMHFDHIEAEALNIKGGEKVNL